MDIRRARASAVPEGRGTLEISNHHPGSADRRRGTAVASPGVAGRRYNQSTLARDVGTVPALPLSRLSESLGNDTTMSATSSITRCRRVGPSQRDPGLAGPGPCGPGRPWDLGRIMAARRARTVTQRRRGQPWCRDEAGAFGPAAAAAASRHLFARTAQALSEPGPSQ